MSQRSARTQKGTRFRHPPLSTLDSPPIDHRRNGIVVGTGHSWIETKKGDRYDDGVASTYAVVRWNEAKQARSIVEWREVNTPPNYPYYPWSDTRSPNRR